MDARTKPCLKALYDEAMCLREIDIGKLRGFPKTEAVVWHDDMGVIGEALVTSVEVEGHGEFLADAKTGTLYDPTTLRCKTGNLYLQFKD